MVLLFCFRRYYCSFGYLCHHISCNGFHVNMFTAETDVRMTTKPKPMVWRRGNVPVPCTYLHDFHEDIICWDRKRVIYICSILWFYRSHKCGPIFVRCKYGPFLLVMASGSYWRRWIVNDMLISWNGNMQQEYRHWTPGVIVKFHNHNHITSTIISVIDVNQSRAAPRLFASGGQNFIFISLTACSPNFSEGNNIVLPPQPHLSEGKLPPLP